MKFSEPKFLPSHIVQLEQGWNDIQRKGIDRLFNIMEDRRNDDVYSAVGGESVMTSNTARTVGKKTFPAKDAMEIYSLVFRMCNQPSPYDWSLDLYMRYGDTMDNFLSNIVAPAIEQVSTRNEKVISPSQHEAFLRAVVDQWLEFEYFAKWMKNFFRVLDNDNKLVKSKCLPTLRQAGLQMFDDQVLMPYEDAIRASILALIEYERDTFIKGGSHYEEGMKNMTLLSHEKENRRTIVTESCEFLESIYNFMEENELLDMNDGNHHPRTVQLEKDFLKATRNYFEHKRSVQWKDMPPTEYHPLATRIVEAERTRATEYLHVIAAEKYIVDIVQDELLNKAPPLPQEELVTTVPEVEEVYVEKPSRKESIPVIGLFLKRRRLRRNKKRQDRVKKQQQEQKQSSVAAATSLTPSKNTNDVPKRESIPSEVTLTTNDPGSLPSSPARSNKEDDPTHVEEDRVTSARKKNKQAQENLQALLGSFRRKRAQAEPGTQENDHHQIQTTQMTTAAAVGGGGNDKGPKDIVIEFQKDNSPSSDTNEMNSPEHIQGKSDGVINSTILESGDDDGPNTDKVLPVATATETTGTDGQDEPVNTTHGAVGSTIDETSYEDGSREETNVLVEQDS